MKQVKTMQSAANTVSSPIERGGSVENSEQEGGIRLIPAIVGGVIFLAIVLWPGTVC